MAYAARRVKRTSTPVRGWWRRFWPLMPFKPEGLAFDERGRVELI